jgi:hypothetical protein
LAVRLNKEDVLLGFFVVFGISYPLIIALIIFFEDVKEKRSEMSQVRSFYSFILGLEECKRERAQELAHMLSENLLREMKDVEGMVSTCQLNRRTYAPARAEERVVRNGYLVVDLVKKEKGMTQRLLSISLSYHKEDGGLKITRVEYEKGS